jgi:DNA-binding CsgD family transcriptional regulator
MGKSVLLDHLGSRVAATGTPVCRLTGIEGWRNLPYALIEQLAWSDGRTAIDADCVAAARRNPDDAELLAEVAALVSATVRELSGAGPLLIMIDDVQHVDELSLACLRLVRHRVPTERLKILCAYREGVDSHPTAALSDYLMLADAGGIELKALSPREIDSAVGIGVPAMTSSAQTPAAVLHRETGGNPLLVDLLLFGPRWNPADRDGADRALRRAASICVNRMGPTAARLARGVAVLGDASDLRLLSMLCQVNISVAERVVDHLHEVGLLHSGSYRHPGSAAAIVRDIESDELLRLRVRAARILGDEADPRRAADQLVLAGVAPDEAQVPLLRDAAERAIAANDLWRAAQYLDLARRCWPDHHQRHAISTALAYLHWMLDPGGSAPRVNSLVPAAMAGVLEPEHAFLAACMTLWHLETDTAADIFNQISTADNNEPLYAGALLLTSFWPGVARQLRHEPTEADLPDTWPRYLTAKMQACTSLRTVLGGKHDDSTRALAEQVLFTEFDSPLEITAIRCSLLALVYGEWLDSADEWIRRIEADERWQSIAHLRASSHSLGALVALRRGEFADAARQADQALTMLSDYHNITACLATATYIEATALLGEHREASRACSRPVPGQLFETVPGLHYLHARATHHLSIGRLRVSLTDFAATGDQMTRWGVDSPALAPWRLGAAQALIRLREHQHAAALLRQQLSAAQGRYPLVESRTRRLLADAQPNLLQHSGETRNDARAEAARTAAAGRRRPGTPGRHVRHTSAAETIPAPRPTATLSTAEQRVAALASRGLTNREIGEELFLTVSTVEQHLTKIYRKLRIRNRYQLAPKLESSGAAAVHADASPAAPPPNAADPTATGEL